MANLRAPAIPLINIDPYFSIWAFGDTLYGDATRHWSGAKNAMVGMLKYKNKVLRFMGKVMDGDYYCFEPDVIPQISVNILPTITEFVFQNEDLTLTVRFISSIIVSELDVMSRPVGYFEYEIKTKDDEIPELYFEISCECCVNDNRQEVTFFKSDNGIYCGTVEQNVLGKAGDDLRIDWGYLHLLEKDAYVCNSLESRISFIENKKKQTIDCGTKTAIYPNNPALAVIKKGFEGKIAIAYDDVKSIEYFGKHLDAYYKKNGDTFEDVCVKALEQFEDIKEKCIEFNDLLLTNAQAISNEFVDIASLAYRQCVADNKLCFDGDKLLFISKECFSNGCAATLDITYPSAPLFLLLNTKLVEAMLNPIFDFAKSDMWTYEFAPHDVGLYPTLNKQIYGYECDDPEWTLMKQMPIEECGNALICVYAIYKVTSDRKYADKHKALLMKWGEYLLNNTKDPSSQLCTDDFGGHLEHNCNLAIKGTIALYACGDLFNIQKYKEAAKEYANWWEENANEGDHYKLTFNGTNTWSIKYNLVWDKIFDFGLYSEEVYKKETDYYIKKIEKYGIPLDSRSDIAKNDWIMWAATLCDDKDKRNEIIKSVWNMINETPQRVPLADYYHSKTAKQHCWALYRTWCGFQNRSVVGGFFMPMLYNSLKSNCHDKKE